MHQLLVWKKRLEQNARLQLDASAGSTAAHLGTFGLDRCRWVPKGAMYVSTPVSFYQNTKVRTRLSCLMPLVQPRNGLVSHFPTPTRLPLHGHGDTKHREWP